MCVYASVSFHDSSSGWFFQSVGIHFGFGLDVTYAVKHYYIITTSAFLFKSCMYVEKDAMSGRAIVCNGSDIKNALSVWHLCAYLPNPLCSYHFWSAACCTLSHLVNLLSIKIMNSKFTVVMIRCQIRIICSRFLHTHTHSPEGIGKHQPVHLQQIYLQQPLAWSFFFCERTNQKHTSSICV